MAYGPLPFLMGMLAIWALEGAYTNGDIIQDSFPPFLPIDFGSCSATESHFLGLDFSNPLSLIACWIGNVGHLIGNAVLFLAGLIMLLFQLVTFNVPGAPLWFRAPIATIMVFVFFWTVGVVILRGVKS